MLFYLTTALLSWHRAAAPQRTASEVSNLALKRSGEQQVCHLLPQAQAPQSCVV